MYAAAETALVPVASSPAASATSMAELLEDLADGLQDWEAAVAAGAAAVGVLQRVFGELESSSSSSSSSRAGSARPHHQSQDEPAVYKRLLELAPSAALEAYVRQGRQQTPSSAAEELHSALEALHAGVQAALEAADRLAAISEACQEHALAQQLTELAPTPAGARPPPEDLAQPAEAAEEGDSAQQQHQQPQEQADGSSRRALSTAVVLQDEEVALLLVAAVSGLQRDAHWMEAAAGAISLESSAEELATLSTLWQLQPFTNEAAADCLRRQAAAAGRGDAAAPRSLTAGA